MLENNDLILETPDQSEQSEQLDQSNLQQIPRVHSCSLIPCLNAKKILLCVEERNNNGLKKAQIHLIGGKVEEGEDPLTCACREFCEEIPFNEGEYLSLEEEIKQAKYFYIDVKLNDRLIHRFYFFNVSSIKDKNIRGNLTNLPRNFNKDKSVLNEVFYWNVYTTLNNQSSLFKYLFKNMKCIKGKLIEMER